VGACTHPNTTTLNVVRCLPATLAATVITHSPTIAVALVDHPTIEVLVIGRRLFKHSAVTCGAAAQTVTADLFLLGVTGVHPTAGLTTGDADEAAMQRALAAHAEKIGAASPDGVLRLAAMAGIVTDSKAGNAIVRRIRRARPRVIAP
jgi:DeoR/GlpR family transcriptional regulator of sugar metabolism